MPVTIELKPLVGERRPKLTVAKYSVLSVNKLKRNKKIVPIVLICLVLTLFYGSFRYSSEQPSAKANAPAELQKAVSSRQSVASQWTALLGRAIVSTSKAAGMSVAFEEPKENGLNSRRKGTSRPGGTAAACQLPELIPMHPSIEEFVISPVPIECTTKDYPKLFDVEQGSVLVKLKDPLMFGYHRCCYSELKRKPNEDEEVQLSDDCEPVENEQTEIPDSYEAIMVSCAFKGTNNTWKDVDIFPLPRLKRKQGPTPTIFNEDQLNIVVLGLDSTSNMNFQRKMSASYRYLTEELGAFTFDGYTKVGDNTFPNVVAVLTGQTVPELNNSCWRNEYFDRCPFLWKSYSAQGYETVLGEDAPFISAFNYFKKGFQTPPTDHYLRPVFLAQDLYTGHEDMLNSNVCYGPRLAFHVMLQYMQGLADVMATEKQRYFQWLWATTLFHDDVNLAALGDQALLETLQIFKGKGYLNRTALVLMSDHGMRWGAIRETPQGRIEERMPLLHLLLPEWFQLKYPRAFQNLRSNKARLSTPFDLHKTLTDLLDSRNIMSDTQIEKREQQLRKDVKDGRVPRGISLFLPIPLSRNCKKAAIDVHWCTCSTLKATEVNSPESQAAAAVLVGYINKILESYPECSSLQLDEVTQVHELEQEGELDYDYYDGIVKQHDDALVVDAPTAKPLQLEGTTAAMTKQLEVAVRTVPGMGTFEATVSQSSEGVWRIDGAISRINVYGNRSRCVTEAQLKPFCHCLT